MKNRSKKLLFALLMLTVLLSLAVGGVYSYMFAQTEDATNQLTQATVTCEVHEVRKDDQKTSITVTNTGKVDAYLRVRLVTYWVNEADEIVAKSSKKLVVDVADSWLADTENDTYYYKYPVKAVAETPNLLKNGSVITLISEDGYRQVIEVFAEAIQAEGTTDLDGTPAVTDAWGVIVSKDSEGNEYLSGFAAC